MAEEIITIDTIVNYLKECVEHKVPVDAHTWTDAAQKMIVLLGDEHDKLYDLEHSLASQRVVLIEGGYNSTKAKQYIEATEDYKNSRKQKARIGRVEEMIRIAKIQARLKDTELRNL